MLNIYAPKLAKIKNIRQESPDTKLFTFQLVNAKDRDNFQFNHGQFVMAGVLGFGEAAFDICSSTHNTKVFDLSIREAGKLTAKLHTLKIGDIVTVRGPFGNGLPMNIIKGRDILLIGGGCGFITMRSLALDYLAGRFNPRNKIYIFYGCLNETKLLFKEEFKAWQKKIDLQISLEKPLRSWKGARGPVTELIKKSKFFMGTVAFVCGPPIMYKFVIEELKKKKFKDEDIYLSLERRMYCGVGVCQHCAIGPYYVCKDGPVFSWAQLKNIPGAI